MSTPSTLERHIWGDQARRISNVFKTHFYRHDLCEVTLLNRSFICLFFSFYCSWSIYVCNSSVVMLSSYCPSLIIFLHWCLVLILASTLLILLFLLFIILFPQLFLPVFFCVLSCSMFFFFFQFTCNDSYRLFAFLHFLYCLLVLTHFSLGFFVFGSTVQCLFCNIIFLNFLLFRL